MCQELLRNFDSIRKHQTSYGSQISSKYSDNSTNNNQPSHHLLQNVSSNIGQPNNGINHHYFSHTQ